MTNRFQVGDAVSFLNEKQNGMILAIRSNGTITVEIEEGFTIDVLPSELVLIKKAEAAEKKKGSSSGKSQRRSRPRAYYPNNRT